MSSKMGMDANYKSYGQVCPVAGALDYIGDRWTILILRELLGGAARFRELHDGLPGIATNLLSERLRRLEAYGLVRRIKGGGTVSYAVTEAGAGVRMIVEELGFWGARQRRLAPAEHSRSIRALAVALQSILRRLPETKPVRRHIVELDIDGEFLEITLDRQPTVTARACTDPDARVGISMADISAVLGGEKNGSAFTHLSGDEEAMKCLIAMLVRQ
jgi:DNA-binding HxlR family transcriptional regulator